MTDSCSCAFIQQQVRKRLSHKIASSNHDSIHSLNVDTVLIKYFENPTRSTGQQLWYGFMIEDLHTIFACEAISVFERRDGINESLCEGF
jgi:hypothetical protein